MLPDLSNAALAPYGTLVAWLYLITNATRFITYLPQIAAVWRSQDGARAISLLTWGSWVLSHLTALAYGALITKDTYFVVITVINLVGCSCVTAIAARRRGLLGGAPARVRASARVGAAADV
jgi:uncharacterized protein with PQ loop repeat